MGTSFCKMKLATLFTLFAAAAAKKETVIEIYNSDGQVAIVSDENAAREGRPTFGAPNAERGPKECPGKKLPAVKNGYFVCHRNLNNSGNKKGKKKKCRFHCDKGWIVSTKKAKGKGKDGVIKCHSDKGWLTKPKKLMCVRKN